jgi:cell division protein FtsI/penicillin-binding protein 2
MAHNTDDLMFRWHERKIVTEIDVRLVINKGIYIPDFDEDIDTRALMAVLDTINIQKKSIEQQIALSKVNSFVRRSEVAALKIAAQEMNKQILRAQSILKERGINPKTGVNVKDEDRKQIAKLQAQRRYLVSLLKDKFDYVVDYDEMNRELEAL